MIVPKSYLKLVKLVEKVIEVKLPGVSQALAQAASKVKVSKNLLLHLISLSGLFICAITCFSHAIRYLTTYFYPAFGSIEALVSKNGLSMAFWLKYWAVFGFLQAFESAVDNMIGGLPFYPIAKACFVFWLYAPIEKNGTNLVYENVLLPGMEFVKTNSLDTLGMKVIDTLGNTLKLQMDAKGTSQQDVSKQLKADVAQALVDNVVDKSPAPRTDLFVDPNETSGPQAVPPSASPSAPGTVLQKKDNQMVIDPSGKPVGGASTLVVAANSPPTASAAGSPSTVSDVFGTPKSGNSNQKLRK